jgi:predicted Rossmann fold nucleotide-binding protein DprA/Smf involved in DNA uptake
MSTVFATKSMKINMSTPDKHEYLVPFNTIPKPPKNMFFTSSIPSVRLPTVAIVGTRKPTSYGLGVARKLSYDLAKRDVIIVSGLAPGTDAIAHHATPRSRWIVSSSEAIMSECAPPTETMYVSNS